jgi:hypothetical protein
MLDLDICPCFLHSLKRDPSSHKDLTLLQLDTLSKIPLKMLFRVENVRKSAEHMANKASMETSFTPF